MRFPNVVHALRELKIQKPDCVSEAEIAINIILGNRPNIAEKYDALLLKLDRAYSSLQDRKEMLKSQAEQCTNYSKRCGMLAKSKAIGKFMHDLKWMRARNADMIKALENSKEQAP